MADVEGVPWGVRRIIRTLRAGGWLVLTYENGIATYTLQPRRQDVNVTTAEAAIRSKYLTGNRDGLNLGDDDASQTWRAK